MRRYHFQCDCWHEEADTIREKSRYLCPEHKKFAIAIEIECRRCPTIFNVPPNRGHTIWCRPCAKEINRERNRRNKRLSVGELKKHKPRKRKKGCICPVCGRKTARLNLGQCYCHDLASDTDEGRMEFFDHPWEHDPSFQYYTVADEPMGEDVYAEERGEG